jgi:SAM-dependent methyltransferase
MLRLPFEPQTFGLVLNLFTSFGYFTDDRDNLQVLREVSRILRPDGYLVMDLINPVYLRGNLVPESSRTTPSGREVRESRRIVEPGSRVEKTISFEDDNGATVRIVESVRLYQPQEIANMAVKSGLKVMRRFGDFDSRGPGTDAPRAIYILQKA